MANENNDMAHLFQKVLLAYVAYIFVHKQTCVSVNGQQSHTECPSLWCKIKTLKDDFARNSEGQKLMLQ